MTCETAGGKGVGPAVIRYCLRYGFATAGEDIEGSGALLGAQSERRVALGHPDRVGVHARLPADESEDQVEERARVAAREEDREARDDVADVGDDAEHPQDDVVRDG